MFFLMDGKSEQHTTISLRTSYEFYGEKQNLEQEIVVSEECIFLLVNQQELFIHAFQDLFCKHVGSSCKGGFFVIHEQMDSFQLSC